MSGHHRWRGYSHEELYRRIHAGPGAAASTTSIARWADVSSALSEVTSDLHGAIESAGASWEGVAADNARAGLGPLGAWADDARVGADVMRLSAELQAEYVSKARSDMPKPLPVTAAKPGQVESCLAHLFDIQTDFERQEAAQSTAEQRACDVMSVYESSTVDNTSTLGRFTSPPTVAVDSPTLVRGVGADIKAPPLGEPHVPHARGGTSSGKPASTTAGERRSSGRTQEPGKVPTARTARSSGGPTGGCPSPASTGGEPAARSRPAGTSAHAKPPPRGGRYDEGAQEYRVADHLVHTDDMFGVGHVVAPPVIGEDTAQR